MKTLWMLFKIRHVSKSLMYYENGAGKDTLYWMYDELMNGVTDAEFNKEETKEMGFKTNG